MSSSTKSTSKINAVPDSIFGEGVSTSHRPLGFGLKKQKQNITFENYFFQSSVLCTYVQIIFKVVI